MTYTHGHDLPIFFNYEDWQPVHSDTPMVTSTVSYDGWVTDINPLDPGYKIYTIEPDKRPDDVNLIVDYVTDDDVILVNKMTEPDDYDHERIGRLHRSMWPPEPPVRAAASC